MTHKTFYANVHKTFYVSLMTRALHAGSTTYRLTLHLKLSEE